MLNGAQCRHVNLHGAFLDRVRRVIAPSTTARVYLIAYT
jgi:hypothetical protein